MKTAVEESKVGIMLAQGFTKKEIACQTHKSVFTVNEQTRRLYIRNHCRNLADITRWVIRRYTGVSVDTVLVNALHDITIVAAVSLLAYVVLQPGPVGRLNAELIDFFNRIIN